MGVIGNAVAVDVAAKVGRALIALRSEAEHGAAVPDGHPVAKAHRDDTRVPDAHAAAVV